MLFVSTWFEPAFWQRLANNSSRSALRLSLSLGEGKHHWVENPLKASSVAFLSGLSYRTTTLVAFDARNC